MDTKFVLTFVYTLESEGEITKAEQLWELHCENLKHKGQRVAFKPIQIHREIISTTPYGEGLELRRERVSFGEGDANSVVSEAVYNHQGAFVGASKMSDMLKEKGIKPEKAKPDHSVCSIGFSEKDKKFYGWSHRAIKGFGIGDYAETCTPYDSKKSDKKIKTLEEAKQAAIDFAESVS